MIRRTLILVAFAWATFMGARVAWSAETADQAALIKALDGAKVTLQQGLTASQPEGRPTSGKFEMEDGKLQLSVYTTKAGNPGSRAVSVTPDLKDGHSTASIQALKGGQLQTVTQKLD